MYENDDCEYKIFFKRHGDFSLHPTIYGESYDNFKVEELYQAFKERLIDEIKAELMGL